MLLRTPRYTRTATLFPYTTLCRSQRAGVAFRQVPGAVQLGQPLLDLAALRLAQSGQIGGDGCLGRRTDAERQLESLLGEVDGAVEVYVDHERSEEHTSELQSIMRNSYAVFCLKKKTE